MKMVIVYGRFPLHDDPPKDGGMHSEGNWENDNQVWIPLGIIEQQLFKIKEVPGGIGMCHASKCETSAHSDSCSKKNKCNQKTNDYQQGDEFGVGFFFFLKKNTSLEHLCASNITQQGIFLN
jgi:hypothetical protein